MITYSNTKPISPEKFAQVLKNSGIIRPYDDLDRMEKMLTGANCTWSAWDGDRLVGIARAIFHKSVETSLGRRNPALFS